jgi:PAS domain S-box-containing protein
MIKLKKFALFVREHRLNEVVHTQLDLLQQQAFATALQQEDNFLSTDYSTQALLRFLTAIEEATELTGLTDTLHFANKYPSQDTLSTASVTNFFHSQKQALQAAIPFYTNEATIAIQIITELDRIYFELQKKINYQWQTMQPSPVELKESEERYKDLFDHAHDLIHFVEPDGTLCYVNNAWMTCLEYEIDEIKGKSIYDFVHEDGRDTFIQYRAAVLKKEIADKEITIPFRTKKGEKIIVEGFISPKFSGSEPVYTRGIFRDITAKIKTEDDLRFYIAQLAEREENLKLLVTQAPDAIVVADVSGKILLWNPKAEEIFGWKSEEALGKTLEETIIPQAYQQAHHAGMQRYLSTGVARILNQTIEITAVNKKKEEFSISLTISRSQQGGETVFISFIRDISLQKKNEKELVRKRRELENSNRELEQYAWLTSHDLREPLRKILTFSDLILTRYKNDIPEEVSTYLQKIQDAGKRMGNLIGAILLYSSITEEQRLFEIVDLNLVLKEVLSDLEIAIKESGAEVRADVLPAIEAVPFQLKQLLQNLVGNAIKYQSAERKPLVIISAETNVGSIELRIQDNGIGFSMQDEKKIFGLFQRLNNDKNIKGTGVGLALCKKIVLNHEGSISVESVPGEGTIFYITLPIKQTHY